MNDVTAGEVSARLAAHEKHCDERHTEQAERMKELTGKVDMILSEVRAHRGTTESLKSRVVNFFGEDGNGGAWEKHMNEDRAFQASVKRACRYVAIGFFILFLLHLTDEINLLDIIKNNLKG